MRAAVVVASRDLQERDGCGIGSCSVVCIVVVQPLQR